MRRVLQAVLLAVAFTAAPAHAHDHSEWSPATSGPRLGLGAADILRVAPPPGGMPIEFDRPELARISRYMRDRAGEAVGEGLPGGPAVVHRSGGFPVTSGPELLVAPIAEQFSTGITAGEPTMAVTDNGTLFFIGIVGGGTQLMRSKDGGKTWEDAGQVLGPTPQPQPVTLDPFIYLDRKTQRLFNVDFLPPCSPVIHTDDEGATYETGTVCNHTDHQNLFTGPPKTSTLSDAYPNMVYYCSIDGGLLFAFGTFTACSKSTDGGMTFTRTGAIPFNDDPTQDGGSQGIKGHCGGAVGHGLVGPDGTVYLPRGWCGQPWAGISEDEGLTWEKVQVADNGMSVGDGQEEHEAGIAADSEGTLYYTWVARDRLPYMAISRDKGRTWGRPIMVAPPGVNETTLPSITAGDAGRVAIVYLGTKNSPGPPYCARTVSQGGCVTESGGEPKPAEAYENTTWNGYMTTTVDATSLDPVFYSGTVNAESDPLFRKQCGPNRCGVTHDFFDVQIGPDGSVYGSFVDECTDDPDFGCNNLGIGVVGHLKGGRPLTGPLPPLPTVAPPPPVVTKPARQRGCTSRRRFQIRLKEPRRGRLRSARVTVNGKRTKVRRKGRRLVATIDLRGLEPGRVVRVRVTGRTSRGGKTRETRRYRLCVPRN